MLLCGIMQAACMEVCAVGSMLRMMTHGGGISFELTNGYNVCQIHMKKPCLDIERYK
jgi:hypothetical protein